jgi:sugar fermentation stimulation protein A
MAPRRGLYEAKWTSALIAGVLIRRRDRFLADVTLETGEEVVAHCVNTGRMEGLTAPGRRVWLSDHGADSARKIRYTWEIAERDGVLVGANTAQPNRVLGEMIAARKLPGFDGYETLKPEKKYGVNSRIDFWLQDAGGRETFMEVKNCHLTYEDGFGYFPDSPSERATKHLEELMEVVHQGHRAVVMFFAQRADTKAMRPSDAHDPLFAETARRAGAAGVEFFALRVEPTLKVLVVKDFIPVDLQVYDLAQPAAWREQLRAEAPAWVRGKKG